MTGKRQLVVCAVVALVGTGFTSQRLAQQTTTTPPNPPACPYGPLDVDMSKLSKANHGEKPVYPAGYTGPKKDHGLKPNPDALHLGTVVNVPTPADKVVSLQPLKDPPEVTPTVDGSTVSYPDLNVQYSDPGTVLAGCQVALRTYDGQLVGPTFRVNAGQDLQFTENNQLNLGAPPNSADTAAGSSMTTMGMTSAADPLDDSTNTIAAATKPVPADSPSVVATLDNTVPNPCPSGPITTVAPPSTTAQPDFDVTNLHTHGLHVDPCGVVVKGKYIASDNVLITYGPGQSQPYDFKIDANDPAGTFWYHAHAHGSTSVQMASGMAGALIVNDPDTPAYDFLKGIKERTMVFQQIQYNTDGQVTNIPGTKVIGTQQVNGKTVNVMDNWYNTQRRITINGQIVPTITMQPGSIERWRMIGATYDKFMSIQLAGHSLSEIALDSLYLPQVDTWNQNQSVQLDSGYRSDVLVQAGTKPGIYMLTDSSPALPGYPVEQSVVAAVVVPKHKGDAPAQQQLPTNAQMQAIAYRSSVGEPRLMPVNNLQNVWQKENFYSDEPPVPAHVQTMTFNTDSMGNFAIDGVEYTGTEDPRKLTLGRTDKWFLQNALLTPHVFHIHINPFQYFRQGPNGNPELVWKDTVTIGAGSTVTMYTQYEDFTGEFVLHCHLVDHEDTGMMENVEVVKPTVAH